VIDMATIAALSAVVIDCADPKTLAGFYREATGWPITYADDDFVYLGDGGPVRLGFQRVAGYRAPGWPDPAKHAHLDMKVADVGAAVKELTALGAGVPEFQPGDGDWVVLTDPEGHAFCVMEG
jgi:predicted enzyme related to lactoylglutathione lyase